ncbi:MAG: adaptor protein MecA [Ruminococcaceae bacterium]|nr:adaptor protein MecA [Oscillospiraceae bacterium]
MEFEKINENTIKVILSADELKIRDLEIETMKPNSIEYQDLLREVLDSASRKIGSEGLGKRIVVDGNADNKGNWIITITKVKNFKPGSTPPRPMPAFDSDIPFDDLFDMLMDFTDEKAEDFIDAVPKTKFDQHTVYCFEDFEALLGACTHCPDPKKMPSQLFLHQGKYYLAIKVNKSNYSDSVIFESACSEYHGVLFKGVEIMPVLLEYGKPIIKRGAISALLKKFEV